MATIVFESFGTAEALASQLQQLAATHESIMILACDANGYVPERLDPILQACSASVFGAVFPSIIFDGDRYERGAVLVGFHEEMRVNSVDHISTKDYASMDADMEEQIDGFDDSVKTLFVFVDGLAKNIGKAIRVLFDNYGLDVNYIGGGSGSLSFMQKPSLLTNRGMLEDALVYAYSSCPSALGVRHGWGSISGPYQVTRSEETVVMELDYKPAFEVYQSIVNRFSSVMIDQYNFFEIAKSFPFGLNTVSDEKIVRDPIVLRGTEMVCVGNVEEGSYVDILQGRSDELIEAAKEAVEVSRKQMNFDDAFMLFIDCISRVLFLEGRFEDELNAVYDPSMPMVGALTFGEIANNGRDYLEFYNKTSVVGHIGDVQ